MDFFSRNRGGLLEDVRVAVRREISASERAYDRAFDALDQLSKRHDLTPQEAIEQLTTVLRALSFGEVRQRGLPNIGGEIGYAFGTIFGIVEKGIAGPDGDAFVASTREIVSLVHEIRQRLTELGMPGFAANHMRLLQHANKVPDQRRLLVKLIAQAFA